MHSCPWAKSFPPGEDRTEDGTFVCYPHKIGKSTLVCGRRSSHFPYHIFVGPEWTCMFVTYGLIIVPTVFFLINVALRLHPSVTVVGVLSAAVTLWFYSATACSDPGIVFHHSDSGEGGAGGEESIEDFEGVGGSADGSCKGSESGVGSECSETSGRRKHTHTDRTVSTPGTGAGAGAGAGTVVPRRVARVRTAASPPLGYMECGQCNVSRPTTAAHCYECGVCVDQLDHHCPWTGKCIAKKNLRNFRMFLGTLCFHIVFVVVVCIYTLVRRIDIFRDVKY